MDSSFLEKQVIGCILRDNTLIQETNISERHFSDPQYRKIYKSMMRLDEKGQAIDEITLMTECYSFLNELGGADFVNSFKTNGDLNHFEAYEWSLIDQYKERATDNILQTYLGKNEKDRGDLLREINEIENEGVSDDMDVMDDISELYDLPYMETEQDMTGIPSGLYELDKMTGGFQKQTSIVMGARPSMGKTATMLKFVESAANSGAIPIVFSLEMSRKALLKRMACSTANLASFFLRNPTQMTDAQKQKWTDAMGEIGNMPLQISDKPMQTIQEIRAKVRKVKRNNPGKDVIVFIDYLTLINNPGKFATDHAKVSDISARLKGMAKEYDCPVVTLAQLSRGVEQRQDKRPMMSDFRESGSIEQDADVGLLLYRESYYNQEVKDNTLEIIIGKQREGPTGTVKADYNRSTGVIKDAG